MTWRVEVLKGLVQTVINVIGDVPDAATRHRIGLVPCLDRGLLRIRITAIERLGPSDLRVVGSAPLPRRFNDIGRIEVDHDDAAGRADGLERFVRDVAGVVVDGAGVGMADDSRSWVLGEYEEMGGA